MKKTSLMVIAVIVTAIRSLACLNGDTRVLSDGTPVYRHWYSDEVHSLTFHPENYSKAYRRLDSLYKATKRIEFLSDKGVIMILRGKYPEAIKFYLDIEKMQPDRYSTASNLGTAYELNGQAEEALKWIKKSYEINPSSHEGSDWLHIKILEAKVKGDAYITDNFLINTSFGLGDQPVSKLDFSNLLRIKYALIYQLSERISFVKPKDKIVARLFFELANIEFLEGHFDNAVDTYKEAQAYGFTNPLLQARINKALTHPEPVEEKRIINETFYWALGSLIIIGLVVFLVVKTNFYRKLLG